MQRKRWLSLILIVAFVMMFIPVNAMANAHDPDPVPAGPYIADTGVYDLIGTSVNDHSIAHYLWQNGENVYVAIATANVSSDHTNFYLELAGITLTSDQYHFFAPGENLVIRNSKNEIIKDEEPTGKANAKYFWLVGVIQITDFSTILVNLGAPGGFEIKNVVYTLQGALNVYHEYPPDAQEIDLGQSVGSNSLAGLAAGTYEIDPVGKTGYMYQSVSISIDGSHLLTVNAGYTGSDDFDSGYGEAAVAENGKVTLTLDRAFDGMIKVEYLYRAVTEVTVSKTWVDDEDAEGLRPDNITVYLWRVVGNNLPGSTPYAEATLGYDETTETWDWEYTFDKLDKYDSEGMLYIYSITEKAIDNYESDIDDFDITNTLTGETEVSVSKTWVDDDDAEGLRPENITVYLWRVVGDNEPGTTPYAEATLGYDETTETWDWEYTFDELDEYDNMGRLYIYSITEEAIDNYESDIDGFDITNTLVGETEVTVSKTWVDDEDAEGLRPENIMVYLWRVVGDDEPGTTPYAEATLGYDETTETWDWEYTFDELDMYDDMGRLYIYSITEKAIDNYESDIDGFDITNTLVGETEVTVTKTWVDDEDAEGLRPPTIMVYLWRTIADSEESPEGVAEATFGYDDITKTWDWEYTFDELDMYDDMGRLYIYSITEKAIDNYESDIDGFDIENILTGETEVAVSKTWIDDEDAEGLRPDEITVRLWRAVGEDDAVEVDDATFGADLNGDWEYTFDELDKYDAMGRLYVYSISEDALTDYEADIDGFAITNTLVGETEVTVTKTWVGDEDDLDMRPDSITVRLWRAVGDEDPEEIDAATFGDNEEWTFEFTELDMYDEMGRLYIYSISEDAVTSYTTVINGFDITNTALIIPDEEIPEILPTPTPIEIPEEEVPQTGQSAQSKLIGLMMLGLAGTMAFMSRRKRRTEQ